MVDEDHEFKSFQELLDFCSHSDFFITGPDGRIISGMYMKDEEVGPEEAAEERKETSQEWELKRHASEQNKWDKRKERWDAFKKANPNYKKKVSENYHDNDFDERGRVRSFPTTKLLKGPFSLHWKDKEYSKTRKWYTANSLLELVNRVNKANLAADAKSIDEGRVFESIMDLIEFCQPENSPFFITDGVGKLVTTEIL